MEPMSVVDIARRSLGPVGTYLPVPYTSAPPLSQQAEAVRRLEQAGFGAAWINDPVGGKDTMVQLAALLGATGRLTIGTGIANIWSRAPQVAHGAATMLAQAYPGRVVLGLGAGYPRQAAAVGREFGRPLAAMRDYLERMTAPTSTPPADAPYPRIIAANGPQMLALAREQADGAMPAGLPAGFTAQVRETLGPDKLVVVGLSVIMDSGDPAAALDQARRGLAASLSRPWYADAVARLGYSGQGPDSVSDELVRSVVAVDGPGAVAELAQAHLAAGADHVVLMTASAASLTAGVAQLEQLAPVVLGR
jgi:probable F420-dependent oxidoreductase